MNIADLNLNDMSSSLFHQLRLFLEETHGYWYDGESGEFEKLVPGEIQKQRAPKNRREARRILLQTYYKQSEELDNGRFLVQLPQGKKDPNGRCWDVFHRQFHPSTLNDPRLQKVLPLLEAELSDARQRALALCEAWDIHFPDSFGVGSCRAQAEGRKRYVYTEPGAEEVDNPQRAKEREDFLLERQDRWQRRLEICESRGGEGTGTHQQMQQRLEENRRELELLRERWGLS